MIELVRKVRKKAIDERYVWTVHYQSPICEPNSAEAERELMRALTNLTQNPDLLACGQGMAQKVSIIHDSTRWILTLEAKDPVPTLYSQEAQ